MLGFPLGILSAAGAAVVDTAAYELISSTILGGTAASVTFSNLGDYSSTYKHLQLRIVGRADGGGEESFYAQFNADTGANYASHRLVGNGSSVVSGATTSATSMSTLLFTGNSTTTTAWGGAVLDILDAYSTTKNKTIRSLSGVSNDTPRIGLSSGLWASTSSITSITIGRTAGGNMFAGSRFSLYGIKG
jgi:hypothetical protein